MPKRKQPQAPPPPSDSEGEQEALGSEPTVTDSSSDDASSDELPSGGEESSEESSDDEAGEAFDQVDVDFEFYCPQEKDFQGLRTLLHNYLDGQQWACAELADAIIQQGSTSGVGSVIKCGEEDDPIGISTVLNLQQHGSARPLQELRAFLLANSGACRQQLEQAWAASGTALVVNERLVNCPPELAEPLQESLFSDIQEAAEDAELPKAEQEEFQLKQYLMVVRACIDPTHRKQQPGAAGGSGGGSKKQQQKKKKQKGAAAVPAGPQAVGLVHYLPEAECYQQVAEWSFSFPVADRQVEKDELAPCRCVMLVTAAKAAAALKQLAVLLKDAE